MQVDARKAGIVVGAVAVVVGAWLGLDALIVTEEEQLEELVWAITGPVEPERIDATIERWTDPAVQPVEVTAFGRTELYEGPNAGELRQRARSALRSYHGERLRQMRRAIEVREDGSAHISLSLVSGRGMVDAELELRKQGERWLVTGVRVHR